jgi:hypothetical protein
MLERLKTFSPLGLILEHRKSLLIVFALVLLAKGMAFLSPLYSIDAWEEATRADANAPAYAGYFAQYRFGIAFLL